MIDDRGFCLFVLYCFSLIGFGGVYWIFKYVFYNMYCVYVFYCDKMNNLWYVWYKDNLNDNVVFRRMEFNCNL